MPGSRLVELELKLSLLRGTILRTRMFRPLTLSLFEAQANGKTTQRFFSRLVKPCAVDTYRYILVFVDGICIPDTLAAGKF